MPKRAAADDTIDPVRSRLAAMAAAPQATKPTTPVDSDPPADNHGAEDDQEAQEVALPVRAVGEGRRPPAREPRRSARPHPRSASRIMSVNRKIMVSEAEADRIAETASVISAAFGSKVNYSQVTRALWSVLAGAEDAIRAEAKRAPNLRVPSKGDHIGMAEYEDAIADFLATALKRS